MCRCLFWPLRAFWGYFVWCFLHMSQAYSGENLPRRAWFYSLAELLCCLCSLLLCVVVMRSGDSMCEACAQEHTAYCRRCTPVALQRSFLYETAIFHACNFTSRKDFLSSICSAILSCLQFYPLSLRCFFLYHGLPFGESLSFSPGCYLLSAVQRYFPCVQEYCLWGLACAWRHGRFKRGVFRAAVMAGGFQIALTGT